MLGSRNVFWRQATTGDRSISRRTNLCLHLFQDISIELFDQRFLDFSLVCSWHLSLRGFKFGALGSVRVLTFHLHFFQFVKSVLGNNLVTADSCFCFAGPVFFWGGGEKFFGLFLIILMDVKEIALNSLCRKFYIFCGDVCVWTLLFFSLFTISFLLLHYFGVHSALSTWSRFLLGNVEIMASHLVVSVQTS